MKINKQSVLLGKSAFFLAVLSLIVGHSVLVASALSADQQTIFREDIHYFDINVCDSSGGSSSTNNSSSSAKVGNSVSFNDSQSSDTGGQTVWETDGTGQKHGDTNHLPDTALQNGGQPLNADQIHFIALNSGWAQANGIVLGDIAVLTYQNKTIYAIYGDVHSSANTPHAEVSYSADLDLSGSSQAKNLQGVHFTIYPGTHGQLGSSFDQNKIGQIGAQVSGIGSTSADSNSSNSSSSTCCPGSSSVSLTGKDNVEKTINFFEQEGLSPAQAVGIAANFMWETGGGTGIDPTSGGSPSAGAFGIAQWTPGSKFAEDKSFNNVSGPDTDLGVQLQVVWDEMNGKSVAGWAGWSSNLSQLKQINDAGQAADFFRANFEGCDTSNASCTVDRVNLANQLIKQYGGGSADSAGGTVSGSCSSSGSNGSISAYQNPLRSINGLQVERIDEGVDYCGSGAIYAVGTGKVTYVGSGWFSKYGPSVVYRLSDGPAAGKYIYFAEHITPKVQVNDPVTSNTVIADMIAGSPCTETGWALGSGSDEPSAGPQYHNYPDGTAMAYGRNFSDFMKAIGGPSGNLSLSTNPSVVGGSLASGWPTSW